MLNSLTPPPRGPHEPLPRQVSISTNAAEPRWFPDSEVRAPLCSFERRGDDGFGAICDPVKSPIRKAFQPLSPGPAFLDLTRLGQYGPRGLKGGGLPRSLRICFAGVESMADDARGKHDKDDRKLQPTDEAALSARFQRLGERLGSINRGRKPGSQPGSPPASDPSAIARGFRLSVELVAGVLVGAGIGWLLDWWLGISPLGMIVFLLLGFAAGVLNVMRAAGVVPPNKVDPPGSK